jgi:hypothetical protein
MPCQSYSSSWANTSNDGDVRRLKKEADKLARIACKALTALQENNQEDFLLLKDDEVRTWWLQHQEDDRKAREEAEAKARRAEAKAQALAKLTDAEKVLLGLKKK